MGPTAWAYCGSPSYRPPSVSLTTPVPGIDPSSRMPMIAGITTPSEPMTAPPYRPLADSTVPIAASSGQVRWHPGSVRAIAASAARYAASAAAGIPGAASAPGADAPDWETPRTNVPPVGDGPGAEGDGDEGGITSWENSASSRGSTAAAGPGRPVACAGSGIVPGAAAAAAVSNPDAVSTVTA